MNLNTNTTSNHGEIIGQIGWKYYNTIKKKAMEQEFSLAGLFLSLSIAFFIVITAAFILSIFYNSLQSVNVSETNKYYRVEITETYLI